MKLLSQNPKEVIMKEVEKFCKYKEDGSVEAAVVLIAKSDCYIVRTITGENLDQVDETVHLTHPKATRYFNQAKNEFK